MKPIFRLFPVFLFLIGLFLAQCKKEESQEIGQLVFVDESGHRVGGVEVMLECTSSTTRPCDLMIEGIANESGVFEVCLEEPATLNVTATGVLEEKTLDGSGQVVITQVKLEAQGMIIIQKDKTTRKEFVMEPV